MRSDPTFTTSGRAVHLEQLGQKWHEEARRQIPGRDRAAERAASGTFDVDMDPLVDPGCLGEPIDATLIDDEPIAAAKVDARRVEEDVGGVESSAQAFGPPAT